MRDDYFHKCFLALDAISANDLFHASAFSRGYFGKAILDLPVIYASVLLEYLLNLVALDYLLLIIVSIVYHDVFVGGVVIFDRVGQPSEFAV